MRMTAITRLEARHWVAVGMYLTGLASLVSGLDTYGEMLVPSFAGSVLATTGGFLVALYASAPPPAPPV